MSLLRVPLLIAPSLRLAKVTVVPNGGGGGDLTAGTATIGTVGVSQVTATATDASGGTPLYSYQWQRSLTGGGAGFSNLSGQTSLSLSDTTVSPETTYFYRLRYTDSEPNTVFSNELEAETPAMGMGDTSPVAPAAGAPNMVQNGGPIIFDTRDGSVTNPRGKGGALNNVANSAEMNALWDETFGNNTLANFDMGVGGFGVRNWQRNSFDQETPPCTLTEINRFMGVYSVAAYSEVWEQWYWWMGRHANDGGSAHGAINSFATANVDCNVNSGMNWGRKMSIMGNPTSFQRADLLWKGNPGSAVANLSFTSDGSLGDWASPGFDVHPEDLVGRLLKVTVYRKAASSVGALDGIMRCWIYDFSTDETIFREAFPNQVGDAFPEQFGGGLGARIWDIPSVFASPSQDQLEYMGYHVLWGMEIP